jgi:hypothetical protein
MKRYIIILLSGYIFIACRQTSSQRIVLNLNGEWQITKTQGELPETYLLH